MREQLANAGTKMYRGTISAWNSAPNGDKTIAMVDIKSLDGTIELDHIWFKWGPIFKGFGNGDIVTFTAKPKQYTKGFYKDIIDYTLETPTSMKLHKHISKVKEVTNGKNRHIHNYL